MSTGNSSTSKPIPAPEDNVKPLNYKDQFSVRSFLSAGALALITLKLITSLHWAGTGCHLEIYWVHRLWILLQSVKPDWYISPCAEASKASIDCLIRNEYDRDACLAYFQAYRDCKDIWVSICCMSCQWVDIEKRLIDDACLPDQSEKERQTNWSLVRRELSMYVILVFPVFLFGSMS